MRVRVQVGQIVGECQHGFVGNRVVVDRRREKLDVVVRRGRFIRCAEAVERRGLGRAGIQLVRVEIDLDRVAALLEISGRVATDRLGNHGEDLCTQIEIELDAEVLPFVKHAAIDVHQNHVALAEDGDLIEIVGQGFRKASDHLVGPIANADPAVLDHDVVGVADHVVAAAADHLYRIDGRRVDDLLFVEEEQQFTRGDVQHGAVAYRAALVGNHGDQLRAAHVFVRAGTGTGLLGFERTVDGQLPRVPCAGYPTVHVTHYECPSPFGRFAPVMARGKRPVVEASIDRGTRRCRHHRFGSVRRDEDHLEIIRQEMRRVEHDFDPFDARHGIVEGHRRGQAGRVAVGDLRIDADLTARGRDFLGDVLPLVGQFDGRRCVDHSETILVVYIVAGSILGPVIIAWVVDFGRLDQDMLDVAVSQTGIRFQDQGNHTRGQRTSR